MEREGIEQEILSNTRQRKDKEFEFCAHNISQNKTFCIFSNIKYLSEVKY